jgi:hypothetical protein
MRNVKDRPRKWGKKTHPHEQFNGLVERRNSLLRLLLRPDVLHPVDAIPVALFDLAYEW